MVRLHGGTILTPLPSCSTSKRDTGTNQAVPLLDISRDNAPLAGEMAAAVANVCESGWFVLGPECEKLEQSVAQLCGTEHAIGCASGSDALLLALMALEIGPGDEVIVPSFTFFATASAVWRLGAKVVFADIDPTTFNIDPSAVIARVTPRTKAIIPVHLFGQCADIDALSAIAGRHGIALIEDAAQAIGAQFNGRVAGSLSDIGCFSFYPTKNLGGCGDGGMLTTNDDQLARRLRLLRGHGMEPRYFHQEVGIASRLGAFQAAALNVKLPYLDRWTTQRRENAMRYHQMFAAEKLDRNLTLPVADSRCKHVWNQFTIRLPQELRDALRQGLAERNIGCEIYYPIPLHRQECFASLGYEEGSLPETERAAAEVLSLPIFPGLTEAEQRRVVEAISDVLSDKTALPSLPMIKSWDDAPQQKRIA